MMRTNLFKNKKKRTNSKRANPLSFFAMITFHFMKTISPTTKRRIKMGVHNNVEGYEDLANAIVKRAAIDYQKALCEDDKKLLKNV